MTDAELFAIALQSSGLSVKGFVAKYLTNAPGIKTPNIRTVWRWKSGQSPIPMEVKRVCLTVMRY